MNNKDNNLNEYTLIKIIPIIVKSFFMSFSLLVNTLFIFMVQR